MDSVYWVFTLRCNDRCEHCYNNSSPTAETMPVEELLKVVPHLPEDLDSVCLSGGEPTVEMDKLVAILGALRARYGPGFPVTLQTNGDLLDAAKLTRLIDAGVDRFDVVSMDRFHKQRGGHRERLEELFLDHGLVDGEGRIPPGRHTVPGARCYKFWGATEELWLKGNWARGRALPHGHAKLDPTHNFCAIHSGARGFLDDGSPDQDLHIQLTRLFPCCPTTYYDLGDVREAPVRALLDRVRGDPDWQALSRGRPQELGEASGQADAGGARLAALGDVCLWCDEYLRERFEGPRGGARVESQRTAFDV